MSVLVRERDHVRYFTLAAGLYSESYSSSSIVIEQVYRPSYSNSLFFPSMVNVRTRRSLYLAIFFNVRLKR